MARATLTLPVKSISVALTPHDMAAIIDDLDEAWDSYVEDQQRAPRFRVDMRPMGGNLARAFG